MWAHTSDQHAWFLESAASADNPKSDWYVWADPKADGTAPNNWLAVFGGPSWTWRATRRQYYLHNFLTEQPQLNYWAGSVQDAILDVARFWLERGVDGLRLDVINMVFHDRTLRDNPPRAHARRPAHATDMQRHLFDRSRPEALRFVRRLREVIDSYGERMTVGEVVDDPPLPRQQEYTAPPHGLHTAYGFHFLQARRATPALFAEALTSWNEVAGWPSWSLGNHDVPRFASRLAHDDPALARTLMAALMAMRGAIFLYQGEELGLPQANVPFERLKDPFDIASWAGEAYRDGARTPMPWRAEAPMAGFTSAPDAWLPLDPAHSPLAVDAQEADPASMLAFTRRLIALRRASPALQLGEARLVAAPAGVLAFERQLGDERVLCAFELAGEPAQLELAGEAMLAWGAALGGGGLALEPYGGAFVRGN